MKTYKMTLVLAVATAAAATAAPAFAQSKADVQAQIQQLQQLQNQATGASFKAGDTGFRIVPAARAQKRAPTDTSAAGGADMQIGEYRVELPPQGSVARANGARAMSAPAEKAALAVSESGMPIVVTSNLTVFFDDPGALQQAARATGGKVVYSSARAGMGAIEFASVAEMLDALSRVQGIVGIRGAEPELVQGTLEPM